MWEITLKYEPVRGGTFYDLLAFLCWAIHDLPAESQTALYRDFEGRYKELCSERDGKYPFLSSRAYDDLVRPEYFTNDMYLQLQPLFSAPDAADWPMILAIATAVDELVEFSSCQMDYTCRQSCYNVSDPDFFTGAKLHSADVSRSFYSLAPLNAKTQGILGTLLPRQPHDWEKNSNRTLEGVQFSPLSHVHHYIWVPPGSQWSATHLLLLSKRPKNKPLKILASPLSCRAPLLLETDRPPEFHLKYLDALCDQITARIQRIIDTSIEKQADIVVLPETMASPRCIQECTAYLQEKARGENRYPLLFLLPSVEYRLGDGWVNQLIGLDSKGYGVLGYNKQHPFCLDKKNGQRFFEPIRGDNRFYVVHIPNVGRIGFIICSDVFEEGYVEHMVRQYKLTLLFHVVFSNGQDLLQRGLSVTNGHTCDAVVCNTCAAWDRIEKPEDQRPLAIPPPGAIVTEYIPNGHRQTAPKIFSGCGCKKADDCHGCVLTIEIPLKYTGEIPDIAFQPI